MTATKSVTKTTASTAAAALTKKIEAVIAQSNTMQESIQAVAIDVLLHAYKHGDYSFANTLVKGLGKGIRATALVEWFTKFGGLTVGNNQFESWKGKEHIKANLQAAKEQKWWTLKPENVFAGYDFDAQLAKLIKKAEEMRAAEAKYRNEGDTKKADAIKVDSAKLAALSQLAKQTSFHTAQ